MWMRLSDSYALVHERANHVSYSDKDQVITSKVVSVKMTASGLPFI